jgi:hypothetical protein
MGFDQGHPSRSSSSISIERTDLNDQKPKRSKTAAETLDYKR